MTDMGSIVNMITRVAFGLMSVSLLVWAFAPEYRAISLGLFLGMAVGLVNIRYLALKVRQVTESVGQGKRGKMSLGFLTRLCFGLLVIMVAVRFEEHVSLAAAIAGLLLMPVLLIPVSIALSLKK